MRPASLAQALDPLGTRLDDPFDDLLSGDS
jgi:hypothetical protein